MRLATFGPREDEDEELIPFEDENTPSIDLIADRVSHIRIGLSHRYNLYFFACQAIIKVYTTQYPEYTFRLNPEIIIHPQCHKVSLRETFSLRPVHSINNMLVGVLGSDEILLVGREDGDVIAYSTRSINDAVAAVQSKRSSKMILNTHNPIQPFFHRNIGASAWGLAIHSRARVIAASANNLCVSVFYPALLDPSSESQKATQVESAPSRHINMSKVIGSLGANIPSISFCNTDEDTTGRWLIAGSIAGIIFWIDLQKSVIFKAIRACYCKGIMMRNPEMCGCGVALEHAIWGVHFLDKSLFHQGPTNDLSTAVGTLNLADKEENLPAEFWDVANPFKSPGELYNYVEPVEDRNSGLPQAAARVFLEPQYTGGHYLVRHNIYDSDDFLNRSNNPRAGSWPSNPRTQSPEINLWAPDYEPGSDGLLLRVDYSSMLARISLAANLSEDALGSIEPGQVLETLQISKEASPIVEVFPTKYIHRNHNLPDVPVLSVSVSDVLLFQPHNPSGSFRWDNEGPISHQSNHFPVVGIHHPLHIATDLESHSLYTFCSAVIPPLGVLVIGSNRGRIAIFSLTKVDVTTSGAEMDLLQGPSCLSTESFLHKTAGPEAKSKSVYSFRFDYFLPQPLLVGVERYPASAVAGIAVGPVPRQGLYNNGPSGHFQEDKEFNWTRRISKGYPTSDHDNPSLLPREEENHDGLQGDSSEHSDADDPIRGEIEADYIFTQDEGLQIVGGPEEYSSEYSSISSIEASRSSEVSSETVGIGNLPKRPRSAFAGDLLEKGDVWNLSGMVTEQEQVDGSFSRPWRIVVTHLDQTYSIYHIWRGGDDTLHSLAM